MRNISIPKLASLEYDQVSGLLYNGITDEEYSHDVGSALDVLNSEGEDSNLYRFLHGRMKVNRYIMLCDLSGRADCFLNEICILCYYYESLGFITVGDKQLDELKSDIAYIRNHIFKTYMVQTTQGGI